MEDKTTGQRRRFGKGRSLIAVGLAMVLLVVAFTVPVGAHKNKRTVRISGDSLPADCNPGVGVGSLELTGDLEGCLSFMPERFKCKELNGFARYREWGTESFVGELRGKKGRFTTEYRIEATYAQGSCEEFNDGGFPFEKQLTGGCDHWITGVSGAFKKAHGLITFFDIIPDPGTSGASNFFYSGYLHVKKKR